MTQQRRDLLLRAPVLQALRESFAEIQALDPFFLNAWVILPDHLHCIWTLREADGDFNCKWNLIKTGVTRRVLADDNFISATAISSDRRREGPLWQRRFREYRIRNEEDFSNHLEYIHYNPVKHGLAESAGAWRFSSFHHFVDRGVYTPEWGEAGEPVVRAGA